MIVKFLFNFAGRAGQSRLLDSPYCWIVHTVGQSRLLDSPDCWIVHTAGQSILLDSPDCWIVQTAGQSRLLEVQINICSLQELQAWLGSYLLAVMQQSDGSVVFRKNGIFLIKILRTKLVFIHNCESNSRNSRHQSVINYILNQSVSHSQTLQ